jgi:hypothetical protein
MIKGGKIMSKENAVRFMLIRNRNEKIKSEYDDILSKYQGKKLSEDEQENVMNEICQLGEKYGLAFTLEDLKKLEDKADQALSEDELDEVNGGRGSLYSTPNTCVTCNYVKDDSTFDYYFTLGNECPDFNDNGFGYSACDCWFCTHLKVSLPR